MSPHPLTLPFCFTNPLPPSDNMPLVYAQSDSENYPQITSLMRKTKRDGATVASGAAKRPALATISNFNNNNDLSKVSFISFLSFLCHKISFYLLNKFNVANYKSLTFLLLRNCNSSRRTLSQCVLTLRNPLPSSVSSALVPTKDAA